MSDIKEIIFLSEDNYTDLLNGSTIFFEDRQITLDEDTIYMTPEGVILNPSNFYVGSTIPISDPIYNRNDLYLKTDSNTLYKFEENESQEEGESENKWNIIADVGRGIRTLHYDNTTLNDHIQEILGYTNTENGGNLLYIGFKVASEVRGPQYQIKTNITDNTITCEQLKIQSDSGELDPIIISATTFLECSPMIITDAETPRVRFSTIANQVNNGYATLLIDGSSADQYIAKLSGQESGFDISTNSLIQKYYHDIDVLNINLEHLVIEYEVTN